MRNEDLKEFVLRVVNSRSRGESHVAADAFCGLSVWELLRDAERQFAAEPAQLDLFGNFVVVGDIHGSIDDVLTIFSTFGYPPARDYIFLGDYVDRGENSIEVVVVLFALKLLFPDRIYLLRGNHECASISRRYGFHRECIDFFGTTCAHERFCDVFAQIPLAAVVNGSIFCVHGGLSPDLDSVREISNEIQRPLPEFNQSVAADLVWSDPSDSIEGFEDSPRGRGHLFGSDTVAEFLEANGLSLIIRAHQFCQTGCQMPFCELLTVFSASDYCGKGNTAGVVLVAENSSITIRLLGRAARQDPVCVLLVAPWIFEDTLVQPDIIGACDELCDISIDSPPMVWC
jgi:diadenosine tetraphosphatase ApaH/serine/threonine PP2A family protein phosphatase